jgi:hypothetical protein
LIKSKERLKMARKVFQSFYYKPDSHRVSQIREMGKIEGQTLLSANGWEEVKDRGEAAIKKWIADEMSGKSCVVVLIGSDTAGRKWVKYEIKKGWEDGKGVVGIYIHKLKNLDGEQATKGANPFDQFKVGDKNMASIVEAHNPVGATSKEVYATIKDNIADWVEEAIEIRDKN